MVDLEVQKAYLRAKDTPERFEQALIKSNWSKTGALFAILSEDIQDPNCKEYIESIFKESARIAREKADRWDFDICGPAGLHVDSKIWPVTPR